MDNTSSYLSESIKNWRENLGKSPRPAEWDECDAQMQQLEEAAFRATPLPMRVSQLMRFKAQDDERTLLGARFLCAGDALLITGETGVGKSSLIAQMAVTFALGMDFFGIRPRRPLTSMIIQAENNFGDLAEEFQGVIGGLGMTDHEEEINQKVLIFEESCRTGGDFAEVLAGLISKYPRDLIFVDPLLSFIGGDVSKQEVCSKFLRNQINPILKRTGAALIMTHHTGKPSQHPNAQRSDKYGGIGSSDIMNWARAILAVNDAGDGIFELVTGKRGKRSGIPGGRTFIKHAEQGIFWEAAQPPVKVEPHDEEKAMVIQRLQNGPAKYCDLVEFLASERGVCSRTAKRRIDAWFKQRVIDKNDDGLYCLPSIYRPSRNVSDTVTNR